MACSSCDCESTDQSLDQGVPREGDLVLRGAAAVGRGDAVRAELPRDGARAGGVPGAGGEARRTGPPVHLHGAEQERHQVDARARVGGRLRDLRQGRGREAGAGAGHGRGVAPRRRRAHHPRPAEAHACLPGAQGTPHVVQHGGGDARQGAQLRHARRRVRDPRRLRAPVRRDHRGGEHPVPVGEGGHPHPRQPRHAPWTPPIAAAAQGARRHLQVIERCICMMDMHGVDLRRRRRPAQMLSYTHTPRSSSMLCWCQLVRCNNKDIRFLLLYYVLGCVEERRQSIDRHAVAVHPVKWQLACHV